ncbi:MAG TPA: CBS domain-containing protein [Tepidiformaceae bacterium]|nr:CBS domain-containing protein [Tepidiformaceae bacterium]
MRAHLSLVLAEKGSGVYTIPSNATVLEAVREMNAKGVGALLVIEQGSVAGIFTERDVLRRIVDQGRDAATTQVSSVMTPEVMSVSPTTTVGEAMSLMTRERVRHLPVLAGDELRGMVSIGDLTRWLVRDQQDEIDHLVSYITGRVP